MAAAAAADVLSTGAAALDRSEAVFSLHTRLARNLTQRHASTAVALADVSARSSLQLLPSAECAALAAQLEGVRAALDKAGAQLAAGEAARMQATSARTRAFEALAAAHSAEQVALQAAAEEDRKAVDAAAERALAEMVAAKYRGDDTSGSNEEAVRTGGEEAPPEACAADGPGAGQPGQTAEESN